MGLREQLEALGLRRGTAGLSRPARRAPGVEALIAGEVAGTPRGECFVVTETHAPEHVHGAGPVSALWEQQPASLARLAGDERFAAVELTRTAFLDIETTGLAGGTGTYAFLVGLGWFEPDRSFVVRQWFMRDYGEEPAQMLLLAEALSRFEAIVGFNSKAFDLPLLQTRLALSRLPCDLYGAPHLDLLFPARRLWSGMLPSCALSCLEPYVLDVRRSEDVPGYIIPSLYFDYLRTGDARPLLAVFAHNRQDILSLVTLAARLCRALERPLEASTPAEMLGLARIYEDAGLADESRLLYDAALRGPLPAPHAHRAARRLSALYKRAGQRADAAALWQSMLQRGEQPPLEAYIELAKHYEWVERDYAGALRVAEEAGRLVAGWPPGPQRRRAADEIAHRLQRLRRKVAEKER
jgi:uncharacterized protein YprB with RNaseH-like and TPR domain